MIPLIHRVESIEFCIMNNLYADDNPPQISIKMISLYVKRKDNNLEGKNLEGGHG